MGIRRNLGRSLLCAALALGAAGAIAAPPEPLVVTALADPDPNFVPPSPDGLSDRAARHDDRAPTLDEAMQDFGRAIGQAAIAQQRATAGRCSSGAPAAASDTQRMAWEAGCRYPRR